MSTSELNVKLYNRRELSGQRSCHPSEVLGGNRESRSSISVMDRVLNDCWTDEEVKAATGTANSHLVMHPLQLNSSYATVKGSINTRDSNGEPLATSYHSKFLGTVDYLCYKAFWNFVLAILMTSYQSLRLLDLVQVLGRRSTY